ncbi:MAG: MFS transporter [Chloroflexi bacterium]|nr:MFS transporter [Chloroflexota bacterium]
MSHAVFDPHDITDYESQPGYKTRWLSLLFICISLLVISLDNTVLNTAIPSISTDLKASTSEIQWIIDAYSLVFAALLLTMGSLGDRYGRKPALQIGLVLFAIGSLSAALSDSTEMLIASRAFLGMAAAVIMPATLSLVTATFPPKERSQAIALWAAVFGLGVGLGPTIGGWLLEHYSWHSVFFVNLPVNVLALIGGQMFIFNSKDESAPKIDIPGVALSIPGLFALVYGIIEAGQKSWTETNVVISFGIAVLLLGIFAVWESRYEHAMLPLHFFKNMSFTGANTAMALIIFSLFGSLFFMSQYMQTVLGFTPLQAGIRLIPLSVALAFAAGFSARIANKLGTKYTVALGIFIGAGGMFFMSQALDVDTHYRTILVGQIFLASGLGIAMSPATNSIMGSVPVSKAGVGSAMNDTTRELGGALGVAVFGTLMNTVYQDGVGKLKGLLPAQLYDIASGSIQGAHGIAKALPPEVSGTVVSTANRAFVDGMTEAMLIGSGILVLTTLLVLALLPSTVRPFVEDGEPVTNDDASEGVRPVVPAIGD